jgi:hypothetical protein
VFESECNRGHGLGKCTSRYKTVFNKKIFGRININVCFVLGNTGNLIANTHDVVRDNSSGRKSVELIDRSTDVQIHAGVRDFYFFSPQLLIMYMRLTLAFIQ